MTAGALFLCSRYAGPCVTPELLALERYLTELYRDAPSVTRLVEQAGLDASKLPTGTPIRANLWHEAIAQAIAENKLDALIAVIESERPTGTGSKTQDLYAAYRDAKAAQPPARVSSKRPPRGQAGANLSDQYRDARIDQMQRDLATQGAQIAGLVVQVSNLAKEVATLTDMVRAQNNEHDSPPLSNTQFAAIMTAFAVIAILVFAAVYWGGNR